MQVEVEDGCGTITQGSICHLHSTPIHICSRDVHGNGNNWDPMGFRGNGSDSDYIVGMGVVIKVWE